MLAIFILGHPIATVCFNSKRPTVWEEKSKIGFQDGGYGNHFGFPICMILAVFHLHVNLLLHCKFQLNSPCDLRDVQNRFSRCRLWQPSWISDLHDFSSFQSRSYPVVTEQVLAQINHRFGKKIDFQDGGCGGHLGFLIGSVLAIFRLLGALMLLIKFQFNWIIVFRGDVQNNEFSTFFPYKCIGSIQMHGEANLPLPKRSNINLAPPF